MSQRDECPELTAEHMYSITDPFYRFELDEGRLRVMEPPGFGHGDVALTLGALLRTHVRRRRLGKVVTESGFVLRRSPDTVYGPDVAFVRAHRLPPAGAAHRYFEGPPDLAVEVRSPNDRPGEIAEKVDRYLAAGTALVWVVDPRARTVTVHAPETTSRDLHATDVLDGGDVIPGFTVPLAELFEDEPTAE
jgi:Uma2 family endonuclease